MIPSPSSESNFSNQQPLDSQLQEQQQQQQQPNTSILPEDFKEQDRTLPIANIARIMKQAVPENAKVSKEAKDITQLCVTEFIAFITSEAKERCALERRKTVTGEDIIAALDTLGFENYAIVLRKYLAKYKEVDNRGFY